MSVIEWHLQLRTVYSSRHVNFDPADYNGKRFKIMGSGAVLKSQARVFDSLETIREVLQMGSLEEWTKKIEAFQEKGRIGLLDPETEVEVVEAGSNYSKVKVLGGQRTGTFFWVQTDLLPVAGEVESGTPDLFPGFKAGDQGVLRKETPGSVPVFTKSGLAGRLFQAVCGRLLEEAETIITEKDNLFFVEEGTRVEVLRQGNLDTQVRILQGQHARREGWVVNEWIRMAP
jgi:hypothetical protein